jgi:cyclopropane-fatty-acyl-phospholipid synthase
MKQDEARFLEPAGQQAVGSARANRLVETGVRATPSSIEVHLLRHLLRSLGDAPVRMTLWNGESVSAGGADDVAGIRIADGSALFKLFINPDLYLGESYTDGSIEIEGDLVKFLETVFLHRRRAKVPLFGGRSRFARWLNRSRPNTRSSSRHNIHQHYDLGNEFYRLWLDRQMVYTCAYFPDPAMTLEEAQVAKMDHVCRKLRLDPRDTVVEAGCGWGALALHMAARYGARVKAFNISREQIAYARDRARALGVAHRVEFIEDDYRNISGRHDAFVSIGMLEHVGQDHHQELGRVIDRCLHRGGRGLLHSIGQNRRMPLNAWIEKRIFPGACPPTLSEMAAILEPRAFSVIDVENLRLHYALTLEHWLRRFEDARERVRGMFDERFVRGWRLYLAGSLAAFRTGELELFQVLFTREGNNEVPWTRAYLYGQAAG